MSKNIRGEIVNRTELARLLGLSLNTIDAYISRGCPYENRADRERVFRTI